MTKPLSVTELCKSYGKRQALTDFSLEVAAGEIVALVGENGAGKTTTLAILSGQLTPTSGAVRIDGHDVFSEPIAARTPLGYVAQDLFLPAYLSLDELVRFVCEVKRVPLDNAEYERLGEMAGLNADRDRLIGELSHGMQRKAAWVAALVTQPKVLLLDEGLAGLDARSAQELMAELGRRTSVGTAILLTEHDLELATPLLSRVVVLHHGRISEIIEGEDVRAAADYGSLPEMMRRWISPPGTPETSA